MKILLLLVIGLVVLTVGALLASRVLNSGVARELREDPQGERAGKVMLLTLPSGKALPVNYLREGSQVFAGADFPWWKELREGGRVEVLIRGEALEGYGRAVLNDAELRSTVFQKLRPSAPSWTGTLVVIELGEGPP